LWPRHDPAVDRIMNFTNSGVIVGADLLKPRLDLWQKVWTQGRQASPPPVKTPGAANVSVTVDKFIRAETDFYFKTREFGKLHHARDMAEIDKQDVVRMNRDTLYSSGVFDLDAAPVTITLPDAGKRFMSLQIISQDHYTTEVVYGPGRFTYTKEKIGTRYVFLLVRTLADAEDKADVKAANAVQDAIKVEQVSVGKFEVPNWDQTSQAKVRDALNPLAPLREGDTGAMFGTRSEVDPIAHLIGTAIGWGGNPPYAAVYDSIYPKDNGGKTVHKLTVKDVPVDGFWSISLYNAKGVFEKNDLNAYSLNNLVAKPNADGSFTVQFGGCQQDTPNCLQIMVGWNYTVRLYRPRKEIIDGTWKFPEARPVN
jgi:para-nitrobenzyl esterase